MATSHFDVIVVFAAAAAWQIARPDQTLRLTAHKNSPPANTTKKPHQTWRSPRKSDIEMSDKNQSVSARKLIDKKGFTADAAAGRLEDVVALPRLLHLPPAGHVPHHPHSSAVVTHRGEEHETEQSCPPDSGAGPSFHGLPLSSSTTPTLSVTSTKDPLEVATGLLQKNRIL